MDESEKGCRHGITGFCDECHRQGRIVELGEQVTALTVRAEALKKELSVTNQFRTAEGEAHDLQIELCAHAKDRGDLERDRADRAEKEIRRLKGDDVLARIQIAEDHANAYHERFLESERDRNRIKDINRNLTRQLKSSESCLDAVELKEQVSSSSQVERLKKLVSERDVAVLNLRKQLDGAQEAALNTSLALDAERARSAFLEGEEVKLAKDLKTIGELNVEKDATIVRLKVNISRLGEMVFERSREIVKLLKEVDSAEEKLVSIACGETEVGGWGSRARFLEKQVVALEEKLKLITADRDVLKEAEGHLQAVIGQKNAKLSLSRSGRDEWKNRAEGAERRVAGLHELGQSASIALQEQAAEISGLREEEKQAPGRIAELHTMIDGLRGNLDEAETELRLIRDFVAAPRES